MEEIAPHLENMLDADVMETGVAIGHDPKSDRYYAVQEFGRPGRLRFILK